MNIDVKIVPTGDILLRLSGSWSMPIKTDGIKPYEYVNSLSSNSFSPNCAKQIIACILKGVMFCHDQGICHRGE